MIVETIIDYHQLSWPFERAFSLCIFTWNVIISFFFSVKVKLFFEFFVMREKSNYFYVKLFSEEV